MNKVLLITAAVTVLLCEQLYAAGSQLKFKPGDDKRFNWETYETFKDTRLGGEVITISGTWIGPEKEKFESVIAYFETATGADVKYAGSDSFEQQIVIDTQAGSPPNIAIFPQPGLAADLASKGLLIPLGDEEKAWLIENYAAGQSWADLGTFANKEGEKEFFGFPFKTDVKSLVWYSPENFADAGYEVPKTMEELKSLTQKIANDGAKPWCVGLGSGGATGWPATDWVEDIMLRRESTEDYDKWVANEMKFNDPKIIAVIEEFGWFVRNNEFVDGGASSVATTDFRESPKGLFSSPPKCYLHHQASFIPSFFPENVVLGEDADFFYFPAYKSKNLGKPLLGSGTTFAITKESEGARAFINFLKQPIAHEVWMAQTGFLSPFKKVNVAVYANDSLKKQGEILLNSTSFRFDASDLMPGKIGAGAFWSGMVDYVGGKSAEEVAANIQKTWDSLASE